uniref:Uncharacterized protein n=1 Tax=Opuntia streptacantha TaxID=393608 RepID=A0A7C8ZA26_OPUST
MMSSRLRYGLYVHACTRDIYKRELDYWHKISIFVPQENLFFDLLNFGDESFTLFYKVPKTVPSISIFTILQASGNCDIQSLIFDVRYHDSESKRLEIFSGFSFNAGNS